MRRWGIGPIAALGATLLVIALGGCGGSGSDGATGTTGRSTTATKPSEAKANGGGSGEGTAKKKRGQGGGSTESHGEVRVSPLKVSGGGSTQYRAQGGDNSIQEFGEESDEAELEEAAEALHRYLVARAEEDWPAACSELAKSVKEQLQTLASRSEDLGGRGCAATLRALTPSLPDSVRRESTVVDAGSLRVEGDQAFLIYQGADEAVYTVVMSPEDGGWKVGSLAATPIS